MKTNIRKSNYKIFCLQPTTAIKNIKVICPKNALKSEENTCILIRFCRKATTFFMLRVLLFFILPVKRAGFNS